MKTILAIGGSNTIGRQVGGVFNMSSRLTVWNSANDRTDTASLGTAFVAPSLSGAPFVGGCNNHMAHAASQIAEALSEDVQLVIVACGSVASDYWMSPAGVKGALYTRMMAVLGAASIGEVDAVFWIKDEDVTPTQYVDQWTALLAALETDGVISGTTPVIIGHPQCMVSHDGLDLLLQHTDRITVANTRDFSVFDGEHFLAVLQPLIGRQFARTYLNETASYSGFVFASAAVATVLPSGVDTKVHIARTFGDADAIVGDCFVAPASGLWRFDLRAIGDGILRVAVFDDAGYEIDLLAYSGGLDNANNNAILCGFTILDLPKGFKMWLGLRQISGTSKTIEQPRAMQRIKLAATYLE